MDKQQSTANSSSTRIVGEARIPLEEWVRMRTSAKNAEIIVERAEKALHHVQVLLSHMLVKDEDIGRSLVASITEFNNQSNAAIIRIENGRVTIELKEES